MEPHVEKCLVITMNWYMDKRITTVKLLDPDTGEVLGKGSSFQMDCDEYDEIIGNGLALGRAFRDLGRGILKMVSREQKSRDCSS